MSVSAPALLHQCVERHARSQPSRIAIEVGERAVSYGQLHDGVERLAGLFRQHGMTRHDRVAVFADNGIEACYALLAAMRADGCFCTLNPGNPPRRVAAIMTQAQPVIIATTRDLLGVAVLGLADCAARPALLVLLDGERGEAEAKLAEAGLGGAIAAAGLEEWRTAAPCGPSRAIEEDLAYILFTSGTTGTPKGVMVSHRAAISTIRWGVERFAIAPEDRVANHSRLSFDVSLFDIFCGFLAGATVLPLTRAGDCAFPGDFIRKKRVSLWFSVPSVINLMIQSRQLMDGPFSSLRAALFAGEALPPAMVAAWMEHQPGIPLYNLYGPTEAAIVCTCHHVGVDAPFDPGKPVPIGHETRDSELLVLAADGSGLAPAGEVGRLMICGSQLADGYWRQPELTAKAFLPNPFKADFGRRMYDTGDLAWKDAEGCLHFVGRADTQVKLNGFRVELGDIEAALNGLPGIRESAAVLVTSGQPHIVAVIQASDQAGDDDRVLDHCARVLPRYMLPRRVVRVDDMPRNVNGKIDRNALAQMLAEETP